MIKEISEYEYLGNSLATFNANMHELNVRMDLLFSDKNKWDSVSTSVLGVSSQFLNFITSVQSSSGNWKSAADLVYNAQGYWEEPISIVYQKTFNSLANYVEIETWLNDTFPSGNFSPTQILQCDYLCKNYSNDAVEGAKIVTYLPTVMEGLAATYAVSVQDVFKFLGFRNQLKLIVSVLNFYLKKYVLKSSLLTDVADLESFRGIVRFNKNTDLFESDVLSTFNQTDLAYVHSYFGQYETIKVKYDNYVDRGFGIIPEYVLTQFEPRNVYNNFGGRFYYKIRNGRWTYHPYTTMEFCAKNRCSDCYDIIDVNALYAARNPCLYKTKYVLIECEDAPYEAPYESIMSLPEDDEFDTLSSLFS